ncbi:serine/threonine-protein kinase [Actinomadura hibisca]|uniref:serine/threonine-protein kinase n=1 Tax=Actinomadura hibisca TaxID=68565 RepID=UPI000A4318AD|nr:serine/threonine-protein kinase [Actinomadura hibisca]
MSGGDRRVPGYAEIKLLGSGSQGQVVLARHEATGRAVAVKLLAPELLSDVESLATFRAEAELLKQVVDPHVAQILDYLETPHGPVIIMEAVPGHSLRQVLDKYRKPLMPETALGVLKGSLLGLASTHAVGVVHRDYKPANVLVKSDGQSKLIDFGVAVLSGHSGTASTPSYMAPEQWLGQPSSAATDIYAATCVFVECITGAKPYTGGTIDALQSQHIGSPPPLDRIPEPLRPLVARGLAKRPVERLRSATEFVTELEAVATQTYGSDWERRGLVSLGAVAMLLGTAIPTVLLSSAVLAPGTSSVGAGVGATLAGQGAVPFGSGQVAASAGKGVLSKLGGAKGAATIGAVSTGVIVAGFVLWPTEPTVGDTAAGRYQISFDRPRVILANASIPDGERAAGPTVDIAVKVSPAVVRAGTKVTVTHNWTSRTPWGLEYRAPGKYRCHSPNSEKGDAFHQTYSASIGDAEGARPKVGRLWLYDSPADKPARLPSGVPIQVKTTTRQDENPKGYDYSRCAWTFQYTAVHEFIVSPPAIKLGKYQLSPYHPVGISSMKATVNGRVQELSPEAAGARAEGTLPVITVIE